MFRASRVTLDGWQNSWSLLLDSNNSRYISTAPLPTLSPPEWDSHSLAARLFSAYNGFRDNHLQCIPQHVLARIQHAFHDYKFLLPSSPVVSPEKYAPIDDPIYRQLRSVLKRAGDKPQREAYQIFLAVAHPAPFVPLIFNRVNRWLSKYFQVSIECSSVSSALLILRKCGSPFFSSLVLRTLAYAWTTGARFHNSKTDVGVCPFCSLGTESLTHIIACPSLLSPLREAVNSELFGRGVNYHIPPLSWDDPSGVFLSLLPNPPSSAAHFIFLACACDAFHAAKDIRFLSTHAKDAFIKNRVRLCTKKIGSKFWKNAHVGLPSPPSFF